jgi:hypothetical protein
MPTTEIFDSRREEGAPGTNALHFELAMLPPASGASEVAGAPSAGTAT